jgi:L-histidine N-alpha-methyltransferase
MESAVSALIHPSRFPERARAAYAKSFRERKMNHQFHYDTEKQAQRWLAIHEAYSPARSDADCLGTYARAFNDISKSLDVSKVALISLGCGGGQKDLSLLTASSGANEYFPADVSLPLALTAHLRIIKKLPRQKSQPLVLDLAATKDLSEFLTPEPRLITFFGMLPNFEPEEVFPQLSAALRSRDFLLLSANLAPGPDSRLGVEKVFHQYNNDPTRNWLATVLQDAGLQLDPRDLEFKIVPGAFDLLRIEAGYKFKNAQTIRMDQETFHYASGNWFQLFFSYRHTSERLRVLLAHYRIETLQQWITHSEEEGIFLCRKLPA